MGYSIDADTMKFLKKAQKNEITEHRIYLKLSSFRKNRKNSEILRQIAGDELKHHDVLKRFTGTDAKPNLLKVWFYTFVSTLLGITFGIKLMERGEKSSEKV